MMVQLVSNGTQWGYIIRDRIVSVVTHLPSVMHDRRIPYHDLWHCLALFHTGGCQPTLAGCPMGVSRSTSGDPLRF